ncbi:18.2 kDa class i heat shock protein [Salvia divinorum]|uniref:18.2 kDa class i heat shock protein n=1 Tax=Salvia divinorum TaxID=28513 RepID=A0ABD1IJX3_SALDI
MSPIPSFFGNRRSNVFDPFSLDVWDPFPLSNSLANTRIDWKETPEAHLFKVDVLGLKKEEVKRKEVKEAMEDGVLTVTVPKKEVKKPEVKTIHISG